MSLKFNPYAGVKPSPRAGAKPARKPRVKVQEGQSTEGKANPGQVPQFTPDPEHCAVEHVDDSSYNISSQGGNTLDYLDNLRYAQEAKRAFLYSEVFGRPLSQRRRK